MVTRGREQPFDFGDWRVDPTRGRLTARAGLEVRLEPQLVDLLVLFAGSGGRVMSKDEIVEAIWGGRAIGDDTLAAAVSRLRRALGETHERKYIETVPKRGYRCAVALDAAEQPELVQPQTPAQTRPPSEAQALAERGWQALVTPIAPNLAQARAFFDAAVKADPAWGPAHRGLAECLIAQHTFGPGRGLLAAAKAAASAAVGLEAASAASWSTFGLAILLVDRDFAAADEALRRAVALDPDLAVAHRNRARAYATVGRFVEAEREGRKAVELDPYSLEVRGALLQTLLVARRYGQVAAEANAALALSPQSSDAWYQRGWALAMGSDEAQGLDALLQGLSLWGADAERIATLRERFASGGLAAVCRAGADLFEAQALMLPRRSMDVAVLRALGGQPDLAFAALDEAAKRDDISLLFLPWLPHFDSLRADPRYARLVQRLRLVH
jgi:DNA-binding winged helix-turn-helix (wHTH) protein